MPRVPRLEVHKLAYTAKKTYRIDGAHDDAFYAVCRAVCNDVDHALYVDLVVRDGIVDECDFWAHRPSVTQGVHQLIVNLDGRSGWAQATDLIRRHGGEPTGIHVRLELMAAFFVDDPALEREWHARGSVNGETAAMFWQTALAACAHRLWANEARAARALYAVNASTVVDVAAGRFGQVPYASSAGSGSVDRSTFSAELRNT
jgi:hypothetical protein